MGNHSRHVCTRHRWVEGAFGYWAKAWSFMASRGAGVMQTGGARFAILVLVSLLSALLLGAVGTVAQASAPIMKFDSGSKVQHMRVPVDKSDTIRLENTFAEALVGDSDIADVIPLTNKSLYVLGKKTGSTRLTILDDNKAVHTIDPWPTYARKRGHMTDGKRIYLGMTRYQENKSLEPQGLSTSKTFDDTGGPPPADEGGGRS